jgi:hypothetical protein
MLNLHGAKIPDTSKLVGEEIREAVPEPYWGRFLSSKTLPPPHEVSKDSKDAQDFHVAESPTPLEKQN